MITYSTNKTILLVDDDPDDRVFMNESFLQIKWNENLLLFDSGNGMFDYLSKLDAIHYPCLILLDYHMPKLSGKEIIKMLKLDKRYNNIPIVVYSSEMSASMERSLLTLGVAACYKKADGYLVGIQLAKTLKLLSEQYETE
ncbi:response regulator [Chitinophagaceae bacterium LB-8]|uniref:Response regulator n=1 Tax=Paraflavisolibacter caeni TaxID=2982496 RepID=A0A9X3BHN8_9BACT|nr:response regulator [Paraflavisolibacter caeni]MCU7552639.1 response regulator [Paraflavisolibacter caeni]